VSHYPVVGDVSETLRDVLWNEMQSDSMITTIIKSRDGITFEPPFRLFKDDAPQENHLSVYLFRVLENADLQNGQKLPSPAPDYRFPPLVLNFHYLITPLTNSADNDQLLLGRTMQVLYDHAIVRGSDLYGLLQTNAEELRVTLNATSLEDLSKLWCAFLRPFRLSVSYEVRAVVIDSERFTRMEPVVVKRLEFATSGGMP
jgi:hypothetical protein